MNTISVIVPIYNAEKYLEKCLDSLIAQTYKELEIILINDGSKDNSLTICECYKEADPRIKVINKVNEGVSVARNTGIEVATGEYIGFVDPDDWVEPEMYETLYKRLQNSDYPICLCNYFKDNKRASTPKLFEFEEACLEHDQIIDKLITNMIGIEDITPKYIYVMGSVWRGLYRKSFIDEQNLRFKKGISIMEDLIFMVQALLSTEGMCIEHSVQYHYVKNPKSVLHSYNKNMWIDQVKVHNTLEEIVIAAGLEEKMRNRLDLRYISMAFSSIFNEANISGKAKLKNRAETIKQICTDDKLKIVMDRVKFIQKPNVQVKISELKEFINEKWPRRNTSSS
ncbi:hypothetical protein CS063_15370 [Sporanaerobium hydrogeniformans]|uniref:Uncharacterized protein n=1 Tax=Sporanaerobium hydrogeniformans TaxID=3072179 RepID=A0AC61D9Z3_9FIRM|nr:hypothetical protein CS063_15370 [Sporanaerobium hydrogeniformans]